MSTRIRPIDCGAPIIARFAGLPISALEGFASDFGPTLERIEALESRLSELRAELVDRLFAAIGDASVERGRRLLLKTKRACFNGRPMRRLRDHEDWDVVEAAGGAPIAEALAAESELAELWSRFERDFATRAREEDGELARWSTDPFFRCGLAVASPTVARESHRLTQRPAEAFGRRERRLRPTLLRYISRAAFKLSPFSTFTPVARAVYDEHVGPAGYDLGGEPIRHRSMVRLRRHVLDRAMALLERYEPLRRTLGVQLNDSEYRTPDGQSCHVRPSQWFVDEAARRFAYREPSIVKLDGGAALFVELRRHVVDRPSYERLVERLAASDLATDDGEPREAQARGVIDQLLDIGWLVFEPWLDSDADHLEADLLACLRTRFSRPSDRHLRTFVDHLDRLVELQNGLLEAEHPDRSCREIESLIDALFASGGELAGLDGFDVTHRNSEHDLYQDVWRVTPDLPRFDHTTARALFDDARPLVRYARLFDHRVELLRTIGEACRGSGSEPRPLLDAFDRSRSLFTDYMKFFVHDGRSEGFDSTWNPLDLADLGELARHRQTATGALDACSTTVEGEGRILDGNALSETLDAIPPRLVETLAGACLFLQPASSDGSTWMLNRLKEGTGRFGSRYTPVMDAASRQAWCDGLRARSRWSLGDESVELVDIHSVQGDTLNVHAAQTERVLVLPGASCNVAPDRQLRLHDLVVTVDADGRAQLRDRQGRRLLPVHLGIGYLDYMPTLVKFLCAFGPSELSAIFPSYWQRQRGDVLFRERTRLGRLILHRRAWSFAPDGLLDHLGSADPAKAFAAFDGWRRRHAIPERVFVAERIGHHIVGTRYSPQYLDLRSPSFFELFRTMLDESTRSLTLFETLPDPSIYAAHREGGVPGHAVEFLLDELAIAAAGPPVDHPASPPALIANVA